MDEFDPAMWTTAQGVTLPIVEMTNSHLVNSYKHLNRQDKAFQRYRRGLTQMYCMVSGEMAEDCIEQDMREADDLDLQFTAKLECLWAEIKKRDLVNLALA